MSRDNRLRIKGFDLQAGGVPAGLPEIIGGLLAHPGVGRGFEIFIVHYLHISFDKSKGHPPVGLHRDRPGGMSTALQRVQTENMECPCHRGMSPLQARARIWASFFGMSGLYARFAAGTIKSFQAFVKKALNHIYI